MFSDTRFSDMRVSTHIVQVSESPMDVDFVGNEGLQVPLWRVGVGVVKYVWGLGSWYRRDCLQLVRRID